MYGTSTGRVTLPSITSIRLGGISDMSSFLSVFPNLESLDTGFRSIMPKPTPAPP